MSSHKSHVSQESLLRQAVLNTSQSIELLREAVSNSVDADAHLIDIKITNAGGDIWNIVIQDNGNGMEDKHMMAFFNAGDSVKDFPQTSIGEKGLGSKTSFVAKEIVVESRRHTNPTALLVGTMIDPLAELAAGKMPTYTIETDPAGHTPSLTSRGTRITLAGVHLTSFNGKKTSDAQEVADRVLHYLRSMCATGTVKNRHAHQAHVISTVANVGVIPLVSLEVVSPSGTVTLGPVPGAFQVPQIDLSPTGGPVTEGIEQNSKKFCDVYDFSRSRTMSVQGKSLTVHYDGTVIIAGESVRANMLKHELKQGWTQKSQMGVHLSKDFIPLRNDTSLSRELLDGEYYFEYKVFLNCQEFQLNADRNVITNEESDEVAWIWSDFLTAVWPNIKAKANAYKAMKDSEETAIEAVKKTKQAADLKAGYATSPHVTVTKSGASLAYVKQPKKEADVSHLLAMMVQSGHWNSELSPIERFGQYIDASTDVLVEDAAGNVLLVEVETQLANLFRHQHPMNSYDLVVVWSLSTMTSGTSQNAPWGTNSAQVSVALVQNATGGWELKWGTHVKPVIVLENIL
ncbi:ATP-binding protein [uncultured Serinicoccus sp.]|uniref:ATP-binding protein n=1 Tax=uncultured Serinicoccus sp. TaxID=735514 RepID=UPI00260262B9|nr:ATP-binding protein [uncultured Serinicoccus sp.]